MSSRWRAGIGPTSAGRPTSISKAVDQHRGWFQSSLLESCGTRGRAPFDAVLTHGFTMDSKGMKMSKSLGNTVNPLDLMKDYGADILRLWALSVDFTEDHRIGKEILAGVADQYRKLRNTFRYLLGALADFREEEKVARRGDARARALRAPPYRGAGQDAAAGGRGLSTSIHYVRALTDFCNEDLSAFYFDIRKDVLYCEVNAETGAQTDKRRANRTVLDILYPRAGALAVAGAGVHQRGSMGHALSGWRVRCICSNGRRFLGSARTMRSGPSFASYGQG